MMMKAAVEEIITETSGHILAFHIIFLVFRGTQLSTAICSAQSNLVQNTDQDPSILQWEATPEPKQLLNLVFE